jgi:hypothetical protein
MNIDRPSLTKSMRFDGDPPIERLLNRLIDDSHAPAADFTQNAARSDSLNHRDPSH